MDDKAREALEELNRRLEGNFPYRLEMMDPSSIRLLDKNARYMTNEMFQNLVDNIRKDGNLSSVPLCYREKDGQVHALSGNHRVMAAAKAEVKQILVFVITGELTKDEQVAIQLSHNAIAGKDDPVLLKALWDEITDLELKVYAGLDTETIRQLESMEFDSISEARLDYKVMTFLFLPEEAERLKEVLEKTSEAFSGDGAFVMSRKHYDKVFEAIVKAKDAYEIVNNPTAVMKLIELAESCMEGKGEA